MDYHNMPHRDGIFSEDFNKSNGMEINRIDPYTLQQIEFYLQQQQGVNVPAVVFEYLQESNMGKENFIGWDYDDLYDFFSHFGEIDILEIYGKISVVLFKTFFDANTAREFLQNSSNFKETEKNNFKVRWFNTDDEGVLSDLMRTKMSKYIQRFYESQNGMNGLGGMGNLGGMSMGQMQPNINNMNNMNNLNNQKNTMNSMNNMNNPGLSNLGNMNNLNNISSLQNNNLNQGFIPNNGMPGMKLNSMMQMNQNLKLQNLNGNYNNSSNSPTPNQYQYYMMANDNTSPMLNKKNMSTQVLNNVNHQLNANQNSIPNSGFNKKNSFSSANNDMDKEDKKSSMMSTLSAQTYGNNTPQNNSSNSNGNVTNNGKYTCRFEIQIENDKDFQVARRLIGAKGCNMKRIVETCSKCQDGSLIHDAVKLRLRGKGSGYKEGPFNKESDEPLHLCISSKFYDRYKIAIQLVNDLVITVFEEYKTFCNKNGKIPVAQLAIRKEEGISTRKSVTNRSENEL